MRDAFGDVIRRDLLCRKYSSTTTTADADMALLGVNDYWKQTALLGVNAIALELISKGPVPS
jgi:hypothetical protein